MTAQCKHIWMNTNFYLFKSRTKHDPLMKTYEWGTPRICCVSQIIVIFLTHSLDSLEYIYKQFSNHNAPYPTLRCQNWRKRQKTPTIQDTFLSIHCKIHLLVITLYKRYWQWPLPVLDMAHTVPWLPISMSFEYKSVQSLRLHSTSVLLYQALYSIKRCHLCPQHIYTERVVDVVATSWSAWPEVTARTWINPNRLQSDPKCGTSETARPDVTWSHSRKYAP